MAHYAPKVYERVSIRWFRSIYLLMIFWSFLDSCSICFIFVFVDKRKKENFKLNNYYYKKKILGINLVNLLVNKFFNFSF